VKSWVQEGCRTAGIGCIECKQPVIDAVLEELKPMQDRAREFEEQPDLVRSIIDDGCKAAAKQAGETLAEVRQTMCLNYR